jgi:hypothetical protein
VRLLITPRMNGGKGPVLGRHEELGIAHPQRQALTCDAWLAQAPIFAASARNISRLDPSRRLIDFWAVADYRCSNT